jgi:hypothetical protein
MADFELLEFEEARRIAGSLTVIAGFPWGNQPIEMVANCLVGWCHGAWVGNQRYTPAEQAGEIVVEAVHVACRKGEKWDELGGIALLYAVYQQRFLRSAASEQLTFSRPAGPECRSCGGTGWQEVRGPKGIGSRRCLACAGKGTVPGDAIEVVAEEICDTCHGKGTLLLDGGDRRIVCPACSTAAKQRRAMQSIEESGPREAPGPLLLKPSSVPDSRRAQIQGAIDVELMKQGRQAATPGSSPEQLRVFREAHPDRRAS